MHESRIDELEYEGDTLDSCATIKAPEVDGFVDDQDDHFRVNPVQENSVLTGPFHNVKIYMTYSTKIKSRWLYTELVGSL